jgi:cell division protein FtsB
VNDLPDSRVRKIVRAAWPLVALLGVGVYVYATLRSPQGLSAVLEKQRQIRDLQQQNANLDRDIQQKRERIRKLKEDRNEQEMVIRERYHLLKEGETSFILQDQKK